MPSQKLARTERVVRAILDTHYDKAKNAYSSDLFANGNTSLSRLSIKSYDEIVDIFLFELDKPNRAVISTGEISVGEIQDIGLAHTEKPTTITVLPVPTKLNPAHAEMPQKITRGLSRKIIAKLTIQEINRTNNWRSKLRRAKLWLIELLS